MCNEWFIGVYWRVVNFGVQTSWVTLDFSKFPHVLYMMKEFHKRLTAHSLSYQKEKFFTLCYQFNPSVLPSETSYIYIIDFKARIDEQGPYSKILLKLCIFFWRDPLLILQGVSLKVIVKKNLTKEMIDWLFLTRQYYRYNFSQFSRLIEPFDFKYAHNFKLASITLLYSILNEANVILREAKISQLCKFSCRNLSTRRCWIRIFPFLTKTSRMFCIMTCLHSRERARALSRLRQTSTNVATQLIVT